MSDPVEAIVQEALIAGGIQFVRDGDNDAQLDFYLPEYDIYIECKQFWTQRAVEQMQRADNVILIQGLRAANIFAVWLKLKGPRS